MQFAHVMQFNSVGLLDPTGATLIAGLAMQATLARIEKKLDALADKVDLLIETSSIEVEAKIISGMATIRQVERRLNACGIVDDDDWDALASDAADILVRGAERALEAGGDVAETRFPGWGRVPTARGTDSAADLLDLLQGSFAAGRSHASV